MRVKLGILIVGILVLFGFFTSYYIIGNLEKDADNKLEQALIASYRIYASAHRATMENRLDVVRNFTREPEIIQTMKLPANTPELAEDRHFKLFEKLEVISRLRYEGDIFIVLDAEGVEQARTQVAAWKKNSFAGYKAVKDALSGKDMEDILLINDHLMIVDIVPIRDTSSILGAMIMGNRIDEGQVRQEREICFGDFVFFSQDQVIASTLSSEKQRDLDGFVKQNSQKIARVLLSKNDYFEDKIELGGEEYFVVLSSMPSVHEQGLAGFMILRSRTQWLREFDGSRNFLFLFSVLLVLLGVSGAMLIVQKAYNAIDFVLEGAHQIIVGNKDYQFTSDDDYLNQLGQTLNLAVAILLGKYIPEDEDESGRMSVKGSLDAAARAKNGGDRMIIEAVDETDRAARPKTDAADPDAYLHQLYVDFVKAKKEAGEDVSEVTKDRLIAKLRRAEEKLVERHKCRRVVFSVRVSNGKVTLKPTPIWD